MKWIGVAVLVLAVLAVGFYFSQQEEEAAPERPAPADSGSAASEADGGSETAGTTTESGCPTPTSTGSGSNRAGLLVTFGDGVSQSFCVSFEDSSISGYQLLLDSGVKLVSQDFGGSLGQAVCKITSGSESDGCDYPSEDCFCESPPDSWVFFVPDAGQSSWVSSNSGVSSTPVSDGGAQAQAWGTGSPPPPSCFFEEICGSA